MEATVAILYQAHPPPQRNGITKPMKPGGYADSGADIAYSLVQQQVTVVTPAAQPDVRNDPDWVFPDTAAGIASAIGKGATLIWLNTVLYEGHPIETFLDQGIAVVGQLPALADTYDDKQVTNQLLKSHRLPIPASVTLTAGTAGPLTLPFPVVAKPIRGRGSQGVSLVQSDEALQSLLQELFASGQYGDALYVEAFLPGEELTITVMPPGHYTIGGLPAQKEQHWSLPPVKRRNHENGIAPYNGTVAVIHNSEVVSDAQLQHEPIRHLCSKCERAAQLVEARAPIRIDCRADATDNYFLFDLNMKPNMTGASRPHRQDQDSLTALAARKIGWRFDDLVLNMLRQHWSR